MSQLKVNTIRHTGASSDAITLASDGTATANITNPPPGNRNLIINGAMNIWQRGNGPYTIAYAYSADRWERNFTLGGSDYYHIEKKTESPPGFSSSLEVSYGTAQASMSTNNYSLLRQKIEAQNLQHLAYGTSSAKKMTLSFWVRSNKTGTYALSLQQDDNSNKQVSFNYSISSADTWEKKTISIPADTSGVINNDTGEGINVTWWLTVGTNMTSGTLRNTAWTAYAQADQAVGHNVNLADSTSNTWYLTGVQLEVSDYATDFEHRSYNDELQRCLRYYWHASKIGSTSDVSNKGVGFGFYHQTGEARFHFQYPVIMRAQPTVISNNNSNSWYFNPDGTADLFDDFAVYSTTNQNAILKNDSDMNGTSGRAGVVYQETGDSSLGFDAEL